MPNNNSYDLLNNKPSNNKQKLSWIIIILVLVVIGASSYLMYKPSKTVKNTEVMSTPAPISTGENKDDQTEKKEVVKTETQTAAKSATKTTDNSNNENKNEYVVKYGDCLWDIAVEKYGDGFKYKEILKANAEPSGSIKDANIIHPNQKIIIPNR